MIQMGKKSMEPSRSVLKGFHRGMSAIFNRISITLLLLCLVTTGCALVKLKKEVRQVLASTILVGRISTAFPGKGPIVVVACSMNQGKREVAHYTVLHDLGEFELMVAKGHYYVFAYWDKNSNLIYDAGEPAGQYGDPKMVSAPAGGVVPEINIAIPEKAQTIEVPTGFEISSVKPEKLHSRLAGAIIDLDDERFSEEHGSKGFWEPVSFFKELGGNIYFLEEYDPQKIPILFIHGAMGTPKHWKYFIDRIDRTRFQPWFFYYPSGTRIQSMSNLLSWKLHNLQIKYNFPQLYITAHSMGGLVARSLIIHHGGVVPHLKLFVSLATPWGGVKLAERGVKQSPAVIPAWIDMQPESAFIQSLYRTKMPETVSFYMFYGFKGSRNPFRSYNDGTIAFSSLLDSRPQSEAKMNYAFDEDHASIIISKAVLDQYNAVIDTFDEKKGASSLQAGGHIKVHFSYKDPFEDVRPRLTLVLQPIGKTDAGTVIFLNADDNGRTLGPLPAGDYLASLGALTVKSDKSYVPVTIENNKTSKLRYVLIPDNIISGFVTSAMKPKDLSAGMPGETITIQSIALKGTGIDRKLHLFERDDVYTWDYGIRRDDHYHNGSFIFYGLAAGEYELVIHAQGYKPFEKKCFIMKGKQAGHMFIELTPEN
jgi:pimeloyl-ACP methyl ester carboxylesterase